jgi:hypothetical protein
MNPSWGAGTGAGERKRADAPAPVQGELFALGVNKKVAPEINLQEVHNCGMDR